MIIIGLFISFFASIFWGLFYLFIKEKKETCPEEFSDAIVVGYGDSGKYTDLIVRFYLDENSISIETDIVDRFDFPVGSTVPISFHRNKLGKRSNLFQDSDMMNGMVHINTPKYIESRRKSSKKINIIFALIATSLTIASFTFIMFGLL